MIKKLSVEKIVTPELYNIDGYPVDGGLMDLRLGAIDPGTRCRTCGGRLKECLGHPGSIDLARPLLHIKYIPIMELFLRCFCSECHKLMTKPKDMENNKEGTWKTIGMALKLSENIMPLSNLYQKAKKLDEKGADLLLSAAISTIILTNTKNIDEAIAYNDKLHKMVKDRFIDADKIISGGANNVDK